MAHEWGPDKKLRPAGGVESQAGFGEASGRASPRVADPDCPVCGGTGLEKEEIAAGCADVVQRRCRQCFPMQNFVKK